MKNALKKTKSSVLGMAVLLFIVMAVSALVLESATRLIIGVPLKEKLPLSRVKADPDIGWVMLPSDEHYTYQNPVKLNALGFRDSEITTKHPREYRILAIGDSHVYGQGVPDKELMTTILEQELAKKNSACYFNVINMGVRAYSTNNEKAMLEKVGLGLDPDLIIIFFYINDFFSENIENRYARYAHLDWYTFDFSDKPTGSMIAKWRLIQILRSSAFLMWAYDTYRGLANKSNYISKILQGEIDGVTGDNIEKTIASLEEIRLLSEAHGARLVLAVIPVANQITSIFPGQKYQSLLKQYAVNVGIDYIDLLPGLRSHHEQYQESLVIPFDGHYNGKGQRAMAISTFDYLDSLALCQ